MMDTGAIHRAPLEKRIAELEAEIKRLREGIKSTAESCAESAAVEAKADARHPYTAGAHSAAVAAYECAEEWCRELLEGGEA